MSGSNNQPVWAQVLVAFLPVFFGSFLFAGVLENYRNDSRLEGTIIEKNFTPMRELQGSCHTFHNDLYLQYGNLSGSYQLMFDELEHIFSTPESELGRDYEVLLKSIFQTHSETNTKASELKETVANCRLELFRKYESLALMTGTYDKFSNMVDEKVASINKVYDERSELSKAATEDVEVNDMMPMMRTLLATQLESEAEREKFMTKFRKIASAVIEHNQIMMKTEQQIFQIQKKFDSELRSLFAGKISDMYDEGFLGWVF